MAYALQAAKVQARIKEEEMQVKVVERSVVEIFSNILLIEIFSPDLY